MFPKHDAEPWKFNYQTVFLFQMDRSFVNIMQQNISDSCTYFCSSLANDIFFCTEINLKTLCHGTSCTLLYSNIC